MEVFGVAEAEENGTVKMKHFVLRCVFYSKLLSEPDDQSTSLPTDTAAYSSIYVREENRIVAG